jgi:hypothetical protein
MHISNKLKATIVAGALAVGGAAVGIATAAAAPSATSTNSTPSTAATPSTPATPSTKSTAPSTKTPCPNMGSGSSTKEGAYTGPGPSGNAPATYGGPGAAATYQ